MAKLKLLHLTILLTITSSIEAKNSRKMDETTPPDFDNNKCGNCPCDKPCNPTPSPPPPSPPPPPKNPSPSNDCPPPPSQPSPSGQKPPSSPYIYINGPPGSVYPVYPYYSGSSRRFAVGIFPFLIGILWVLPF